MSYFPKLSEGDWNAVRRNFRKIGSSVLGPNSSVIFHELTLNAATASRLTAFDANKNLVSSDLVNWVAGTTNQITVADDGDGSITLATPQDIHVDAVPEFAGITIKDSGGDVIFYADNDEMYFTGGAIAIADGMSIGLLLALTYKT